MSDLSHVVRYIRNADSYEGTAAVTLKDRPNLEIGGEPQALTDEEFNLLSGRGLVFEEIDDDGERKAAIDRAGADGAEPLPATATAGSTPPNPGGGGGAAGPEGASGSGAAGGRAAAAGESGGGRP